MLLLSVQPYIHVFCSYVSAMVPVKTMKEYDMAQEVTVLFSETVQRSVKMFSTQHSFILFSTDVMVLLLKRIFHIKNPPQNRIS